MESSSNDSFFWADASNDSSDEKNKIVKSMKTKPRDEPGTSANYKQKEREQKNLGTESENEPKKMQLKSKKRKYSEAVQENSDYSHPEKKRIKLEPESDIDIEKKKKSRKDKNSQDSIVYSEEYLNLRVKQEETSLVQTKKKKKKKRSNSHIENASQSDSSIEPNRERFEKDLRIKQEQISVVEPEVVKSKKKKKHKRSTVSPDIEIASEAKPVTTINEVTVPDELAIRVKQEETSLVQSKKKKKHKRSTVSSDIEIASEAKPVTKISEVTVPDELTKLGEPSEYSIIEEKFFAEETVVEKPRKNKRKKDAGESNNIDDNNKSIYLKNNAEVTPETDSDNLNNVSLEPNDFTCNNIVSSTILNSSATEFRDTKGSENEELVKKNKNIQPRKISDRIRFEEDDNSIQQDPQFDKISDKINRFLKVNPQLRPYIWKTSKDSLITKDDEIWTLTWPHEINVEKLRNTTVSSEDKCKLKIDGQTYDGVLNQDVAALTLLTHEHMQAFIKSVPVKECIDYHKRIPKVHIPDNNIMVDNQRNFIPLPETKCRHPLFGAHYKKAIKISTAVVERLQAAKERHSETPSENVKKKKHKKQKHKSADIKSEDCLYIKPEQEAFKKTKMGRKCSQENDGPPKKLKRVNENADSPAVWESEKAIEENLFNF